MVRVSEISGLTQARRLSEAGLMARELIAVTRDVPIEDVEVTLTIDAVGGVTDIPGRLARIRNERQQAAELERSASRAAADLAKALNQADVPLRDVGSILGVSHQRAHQLVTS
jgi:hypothetical protein